MLAKQVGAVSYVECSSRSSERSVRDVFHVATVAAAIGSFAVLTHAGDCSDLLSFLILLLVLRPQPLRSVLMISASG